MEGNGAPNTLLVSKVFMPHTDGFYLGVLTSVVGVCVWVEHPGDKEMFLVERHLWYAFHALTVSHREQQKALAAAM